MPHYIAHDRARRAYRSELRLDARQAHDDGLDKGHVGEPLQRLHQDPQQLLDVVVGDGAAWGRGNAGPERHTYTYTETQT